MRQKTQELPTVLTQEQVAKSEAAQTLLRFGQNERGGTPGFLAVLHTGDQKLKAHFHLHCRVAGGVVADNGQRWIAFKGNYLFNQTALSRVFRGKFMQLLHRAWQTQKLTCDPQWKQTLKHTLLPKTGWSVCVTRSNSRHRFLIIWPAIPTVDITAGPCCHRGQMLLVFEIPNYWSRAPIRRLACAGYMIRY